MKKETERRKKNNKYMEISADQHEFILITNTWCSFCYFFCIHSTYSIRNFWTMYLDGVKALNESSQIARFEITWRFSNCYMSSKPFLQIKRLRKLLFWVMTTFKTNRWHIFQKAILFNHVLSGSCLGTIQI